AGGLALQGVVGERRTWFTARPSAAPRRLAVPDRLFNPRDPDRTTTVCLDRALLVAKHDGGRVGVWVVRGDRATKVRELSLPSPADGVWLTPDGRHLATYNGNGTVYVLRLWDRNAGP